MALQPHRVASTRRLAAGMLTCFSVSWCFGFFFLHQFSGNSFSSAPDHETVQLSERPEANKNSPPFFKMHSQLLLRSSYSGCPHQQPPTYTHAHQY